MSKMGLKMLSPFGCCGVTLALLLVTALTCSAGKIPSHNCKLATQKHHHSVASGKTKFSIERVTDSVVLGEGPHWDVSKQSLYFADIYGNTIQRYVPATNECFQAKLEGMDVEHVTYIIPVEGKKDQFIIGTDLELNLITWDGTSDKISAFKKFAQIEDPIKFKGLMLNDGKCDSSGRLWTGLGNPAFLIGDKPKKGHDKPLTSYLYSIDKSGKVVRHIDGIGISNGLAWSIDDKYMYYIDSIKGTVDQYDFDIIKGTISNGKAIFTLSKHNMTGLADGMTIDTEGNLWVANFDGYQVFKIDPRRPETLLDTIPMPTKQTASVAFGGPNLDELYVTTGSYVINDIVLPRPINGATYKVSGLKVKGLPGASFKL